jgi:4-amino-4-deoxy-L-arabinose transferase-like glycosyltransferase
MTLASPARESRLGYLLAALAVALIVLLPRSFDLTSDPAEYWPFGTAWGDEGAWNHPAEYAAATGHWPQQPYQVQYLVPLYAWSQRGVSTVLGSGLPQARLLSLLCGVLTAGVVACMIRPLGRNWALFAAALYGSNFWAIAVDRTATPEPLCNLLLGLAMWRACKPGASLRTRFGASLVLASLAIAAKPPAMFGILTVVVFAFWSRSDLRRSYARALLVALGLLTVVVAALYVTTVGREALAMLYDQVRLVLHTYNLTTQKSMDLGRMLGLGWIEALIFYLFVVYLSGPICGAVLLLLLPPSTSRDLEHASRLARFATLWLVAWWLLVPLSGFRGFRVAFLLVPLVVLGTLGFARLHGWLLGQSRQLRWRRGVPAMLWLAAMWSAWLADQTGWRARFWLFVLVAMLAVLWQFQIRRPSPGSNHPRISERRVAVLMSVLMLAQLAIFAAWVPLRTHLVVDAQRTLNQIELGDALVCGAQAPALMLAAPLNGRPLYSPYGPDCRLGGRLSDYVLLPRGQECLAAHPQPFMVDNSVWLSGLPELARVRLHQWNGSHLVVCDFSLVRLPAAGAM